MKIKIKSCSNKDCWYFNKIGEEFDVLSDGNEIGYLIKKNITINFYVEKDDCEILTNTKENKND